MVLVLARPAVSYQGYTEKCSQGARKTPKPWTMSGGWEAWSPYVFRNSQSVGRLGGISTSTWWGEGQDGAERGRETRAWFRKQVQPVHSKGGPSLPPFYSTTVSAFNPCSARRDSGQPYSQFLRGKALCWCFKNLTGTGRRKGKSMHGWGQ